MRTAIASVVVVLGLSALPYQPAAAGDNRPVSLSGPDTSRHGHCHDVLARGRGGGSVVDPDEMSRAQISASDAALGRAEDRLRQSDGPDSSDRTAGHSRPSLIAVHVHVLRTGTHGAVRRSRIVREIAVLNDAYSGRQSLHGANAPFRFRLAGVDVSRKPAWYRMDQGTTAERRAKQALHRGGARALNLYIGDNAAGLLGWATQPTAYRSQPKLDGVVIARRTLPGGGGGRYSAGDAAVHEIGHWFGLFHTFAGRCSRRGDLVADTPAEGKPNYACPVDRNTCSARGLDPVHNFMDYSYDACMNRFTQGQVKRMIRSWAALRSGPGPGHGPVPGPGRLG